MYCFEYFVMETFISQRTSSSPDLKLMDERLSKVVQEAHICHHKFKEFACKILLGQLYQDVSSCLVSFSDEFTLQVAG